MVYPKKEFALYKGDELLAIGTAEELADQMKVSKQTILFYGHPSYRKRTKDNKARRLVCLND